MLSDFKFSHIGIAVKSIKTAAQYYLDAGYRVSDTVYDPLQDVSVAFLDKSGMPRIELVEPGLSVHCAVSKIIEKSGVSPYHICYETENIENAINELKKKKYLLLARPVNAVALNDRKICFLYNKEVGLIELTERAK